MYFWRVTRTTAADAGARVGAGAGPAVNVVAIIYFYRWADDDIILRRLVTSRHE